MGMLVSHVAFTDEELDDYQSLTFFSKQDIIRIYERFEEIDPDTVDGITCTLPQAKIADLVELRANPFRDRICQAFSSQPGDQMSFEDFLNMASVFSDAAPKRVKIEYAFKIYDFDDDDMLSKDDLIEVLKRLTGEQQFTQDDLDRVVEKILEESDLDEDGMLSYPEFEHVISKSPDFLSTFGIKL